MQPAGTVKPCTSSALDQHLALGARGAVADHLARALNRAELTAARRAAHNLAAVARARVHYVAGANANDNAGDEARREPYSRAQGTLADDDRQQHRDHNCVQQQTEHAVQADEPPHSTAQNRRISGAECRRTPDRQVVVVRKHRLM